jgi:nucleoside-triphosphatase THEP1
VKANSKNVYALWGITMKIILTAPPQTGKSTLLGKLLASTHLISRGIYSKEKLVAGVRDGFSVSIRDGEERAFMTKDRTAMASDRNPRVGSYTVCLDTIETFIVPELLASLEDSSVQLVYIDEIGRAQAHSTAFLEATRKIFQRASAMKKSILATIVQQDTEWSMEFKQDSEVWLVEVTPENRDALVGIIDAMLRQQDIIAAMSAGRRKIVKNLFHQLMVSKQFVAAKKLFTNALQYSELLAFEATPAPAHGFDTAERTFRISGKTEEHDVVFNVGDNQWRCDCPLSRGSPPFSSSETCSHQLAVMIALERIL